MPRCPCWRNPSQPPQLLPPRRRSQSLLGRMSLLTVGKNCPQGRPAPSRHPVSSSHRVTMPPNAPMGMLGNVAHHPVAILLNLTTLGNLRPTSHLHRRQPRRPSRMTPRKTAPPLSATARL